MDITQEQYLALLTDIIAKQVVILGPDVAIMRARTVSDLEVTDAGQVTNFDGDGAGAVKQLVDAYIALSGQIVEIALQSVFEKYPSLTTSH